MRDLGIGGLQDDRPATPRSRLLHIPAEGGNGCTDEFPLGGGQEILYPGGRAATEGGPYATYDGHSRNSPDNLFVGGPTPWVSDPLFSSVDWVLFLPPQA